MVKSTVKFVCGCGKSWDNPLEATAHVEDTGHTVDVQGKLTPDKKEDK
jgi:hypothetical protein